MLVIIPLSGLRLFLGLPVAAAITGGLFLLMSGVLNHQDPPPPIKGPGKIDFTASNDPIDKIIDIPDSRPSIDDIKPPVVPTTPSRGTGPTPGPIPSDPSPTPRNKGGDGVILPQVLAPIVRIEPVYPDNCASRGVEGVVEVEFDISPQGAVLDPRIVTTSNRCFNRAVLSAVRGWKYTPTGKTTRNVRTSLTFRLQQ